MGRSGSHVVAGSFFSKTDTFSWPLQNARNGGSSGGPGRPGNCEAALGHTESQKANEKIGDTVALAAKDRFPKPM